MHQQEPQKSDVRVRHACPSDAPLIAELDKQCGCGGGKCSDYRVSLTCQEFVVFIAYYCDVAVGLAAAVRFHSRKKKDAITSRLSVWALGVLKGEARRVVASQLLDTLKSQMRETKCEEITSLEVPETDLEMQLILRDNGFKCYETKGKRPNGKTIYQFRYRPFVPVNRISKHLADAAGETT